MRAAYYIRRLGAAGAVAPHVRTLVSRPARYLAGLLYALGLAGGSPRRLLNGLFYFVEAVLLGDWMARTGVSHVHVQFATTVGLIAARIFPITLSMTIHGPAEFDDAVGFRLADKVRAAAFVCATSRWARSQLMRLCDVSQWPKLHIVPQGVDPAVFRPCPFRERPSPFQIICVGRLAPVKGLHVLVEAVDLLVRQGRRVRLRLVGDGPDRASLEREVSTRGLTPHVSFEGWANQDRVRAFYAESDIFALPSFAEGVPTVLMEAMAMEIPCVATAIAGIPELIRDGVDGILVPPSDGGQLADAIARLMDDPGLRRRLGAAGRRSVMERYALRRNAAALADLLGPLTSQNHRARAGVAPTPAPVS